MSELSTLVFVGSNTSRDLINWVDVHDRSILIEPLPHCVEVLREKFGDKVEVIECACGDVDAEDVPFHVYNHNGLSSSLGVMRQEAVDEYSGHDLALQDTIAVRVRRLPDILEELGVDHITTLAIDAQGMDLAILKTMKEWLSDSRVDLVRAESDAEGFRHYDGVPDNSRAAHIDFMSALPYSDITATASRGEKNPDLTWKCNESETVFEFVSEVKLNLGSGRVEIEGFTPIDRKLGDEVYPLANADESVDEIRASHILEHFGHGETDQVLSEWVRVLKPGGRIRIAVPDFEKVVSEYRDDPKFEGYLFGGQLDEDDFHKSMWTRAKLAASLERAGVEQIREWHSDNTDCASLPLSLNLEGTKRAVPSEVDIKVSAIMSVPRYGSLAARGLLERAFGAHGIPILTTQGVFWGQCMQRMMEDLASDIDIVITLDFDTVCTSQQVADLLRRLCEYDDIDCLAALEPKRNADNPLMTSGGATSMAVDGSPMIVKTAHFGLTAFRMESLRKMAKPWFQCTPDKDGSWREGRLDGDIFFWKQFEKAGNVLGVDPTVRIAHLEETVSYYDEQLTIQRCSVPEWRDKFLK